MTIHTTHPFAEPDRDPGRRLRGRLGGRVTLWTSGDAGLTVSSVMVVHGDPFRVLAALDPDADLTSALEADGVAAMSLLSTSHRRLAEVFAGQAPSPGGPFRASGWAETAWGRVPEGVDTWAGLRLETSVDVGWSRLVTCTVEHVGVGEDASPLHQRRGRWATLT